MMFTKRISYVLLFSLTALISCKQSSTSNEQSTQNLSNTNSMLIPGIPSLGLAGTYNVGVDLGDADFVVIRDCDPTGKQCKNDILTSDDAALGNTVMMDISFQENDPNFIQTIACLAKSKITNSSNIDQDFPKDVLGAKHVTADFKINGTNYTCVVSVFAKRNLPAWVASQVNTSTSTVPESSVLLGVAVPSNANSGMSSTDATLIGASVGFAVGFLAGVGIVKYTGAQRVTNLKSSQLNTKLYAKNVLITDFDGTLGLGDYEPHPDGYKPDESGKLSDKDWEDFCKRKLGGRQGLKELRRKFPNDIKEGMSAAKIVEILNANPHFVPELKDLHEAKGFTLDELLNKGYMVKLGNNYYNAPTWLNGAVEMLHEHIAAGHLVIFNSTNFRRNVASGIEASLAQQMQNKKPSVVVRKDAGLDYRARNPKSGKSQWPGVYFGTAAVLGVGPRTLWDKLNAIIAGIRVRILGDKAEIGRRVYQEAINDPDVSVRIAENAQVVSIDDKPGKAKEFASFLSDVSPNIKHIFIQSSATTESNSVKATEHIQAAREVFVNGAFENVKLKEGGNLVVTNDKVRTALTGKKVNAFDVTYSSKYISPQEAKASGNNIKSGLAGILMGAVLGGVGGILGNQLGH